jgi:hypothetical protein
MTYQREPCAEESPAALRTYSWDGAHYRYTQGRIGQVAWEAFAYAWRRGAFHYSSVGQGYEHPVDEQVRELGNAIMGEAAPGTCPCPDGERCTR